MLKIANPSMRVTVGIKKTETKNQIKTELQEVATKISESSERPKVTVGIKKTETKNQINQELQELKLKNIKGNITFNIDEKDITQKTTKVKSQINSLFDNVKRGGGFETSLKSFTADISKLGADAEKYVPKIKDLKNRLVEMRQTQSNYDEKNPENPDNKKVIADLREQSDAYKELYKDMSRMGTVNKKVNSANFASADNIAKLNSLINTTERYLNVNNRINQSPKLKANGNNILAKEKELLNSGVFSNSDVRGLTAEFNKYANSVKSAGKEGQTFFSKLSAQVQKLGVYFSAATVMLSSWAQLKNMVQMVIELDKTVTDLQVATGGTRSETQQLLNTYSNLGKEIGATSTEVASAADDWLRQNKTIEETNKLTKDSIMLSKLSKLSSAEATKALTAIMKSYNIEAKNATSIVDKLVTVDMKAAVGAGDIAKALQETSVSAKMAGLGLSDIIGLVTTVAEVSQDAPESVGNFFKSFLSRMSSIKEGRLVDPETGEDLSTVESVLNNIGIKLRDNVNHFRNFGNVLDEIAVKWNELEKKGDTVGQSKIANALGLTRQQEKTKILFEHYEEAKKYAEIAENSLGTAEEKYSTAYTEGVASAANSFEAQYEKIANTVFKSDLIAGTINTGTGLLGVLTKIIDKIGLLNTMVPLFIAGISGISNKGINKYALPYPLGMVA